MNMDVQFRGWVDSRIATAWICGIWGPDLDRLERLSDAFFAVACLAIVAVILRSMIRKGQPRQEIASRVSVWLLGALLVVCGLIQLGSAIAGSQVNRAGGMALLSAVAWWAAALNLRPIFAHAPAAGDAEEFRRQIAERHRAEAALRSSEAETRKLAEADMRKNEFLAMLGHELRNPLAPIRNAVKIMKQRGSDDPDLCWARDVVEHQVRQMGHLVDDLLEISRVTSGKVRLHKEPVDVATIVAFAVETSRPGIEKDHHQLSISQPPHPVLVSADSLRMSQVLSNLLSNAVKYTPSGGLIRLSVAEEGTEVVFRVRDNGIGIPQDMLGRIFDLFTQVDHSLDHSQGGLGLGLTLVKSLVEMHGGSVEAHSDGLNRGGSEFLVRLPILTEVPDERTDVTEDRQTGLAHRTQSSPAARRVLVVDDNVTSAQSLAMVLKLEGHNVLVAYNGGLALETVVRFRPQVVLMDIGLPGMDGYELARRIRSDAKLGAGIELLVAVTGYAEDEARRASREAGFDHHLVKPVDPDSVLALLSSLEWEEEAERPEPGGALRDQPAILS
jgi:signal transduction histidine kinase/CheY-like chemotaxis protein